jgi:hypothetical protein
MKRLEYRIINETITKMGFVAKIVLRNYRIKRSIVSF